MDTILSQAHNQHTGTMNVSRGIFLQLFRDIILIQNKIFPQFSQQQMVKVLFLISVPIWTFVLVGLSTNCWANNSGSIKVANNQANGSNTAIKHKDEVHIRFTLEQYKRRLRKREAEVSEELAKTPHTDRKLLQSQLYTITNLFLDINYYYTKQIKDLEERITRLESIRGQVPDQFLKEAKAALRSGDTQKADKLFAEITNQHQLSKNAATESNYQRCRIAEDDIRYSEALLLCMRVVKLAPDNTTYLNIFGKLLYTVGKYEKAIEYYERALAGDLKTYGKHHPKVATDYDNLGLAWDSVGKYRTAIKYYESALKSDLITYGEKHPKVAKRRNNLGLACNALGKNKKAIEYYELALESDLKTYGEQHPRISTTRNNLGAAWDSLGEYKKAIESFELVLKSNLKTYGEHHPATATTRNNLGAVWGALREYKKAIEYYELALVSDLITYGEQHPNVAVERNNLGVAWDSLGEYKKAIEYYELALESDLETYGKHHPNVAVRYSNLGSTWQGLGDYKQAIEYFERALAIFVRKLGKKHPHTRIVHRNLLILQGTTDVEPDVVPPLKRK